ncbi:pesticidal protein Cry7Aa [Candidatus Wolfebacteria bacterium]|nr:pesticidal protein Cry7Aa [Candidatus Wolfebacteria bacterium]
MVTVEKLGIILEPTSLDFEREAVLNPGVYQEGEWVHLFYRAIDAEKKSSIGYAKLKGPREVVERWNVPFMTRRHGHESQGVEDPRIVKIDNLYYMTYVIHDGKNALTAYAVSSNLKKFEEKAVISPEITYDEAGKLFGEGKLKDRYFMFSAYYERFAAADVMVWEKDIFFFPKKINGRYALIHRVLPDIQILYFDDFKQIEDEDYWREYLKHLDQHVVLENKYWFESRNIGGGAPPVETKDGWLLIFHAVEELNKARIYRASAALLDKKDPLKVIGRLDYPLLFPEKDWEKNGFVNNVVFPTGTAIFGDDLYIYYGAADRVIGVARVNLDDLLKEVKKPHAHERF